MLLRVIGASIGKCERAPRSGDEHVIPCASSKQVTPPIQFSLKRVSGMMMPNKFISIGALILTPQRGMPAGVYSGQCVCGFML